MAFAASLQPLPRASSEHESPVRRQGTINKSSRCRITLNRIWSFFFHRSAKLPFLSDNCLHRTATVSRNQDAASSKPIFVDCSSFAHEFQRVQYSTARAVKDLRSSRLSSFPVSSRRDCSKAASMERGKVEGGRGARERKSNYGENCFPQLFNIISKFSLSLILLFPSSSSSR